MVKHMVCFKLKDGSKENMEKAKEIILSMNGNVPMISNLEVQLDGLRSARSYDVLLSVDVKDWKALDDYQNDPYHCSVVKAHMHEAAAASVAFDYEF